MSSFSGFSGKYYYTVDPKGRIIVPSDFRKTISNNYSTKKLYVTNALFDRCLLIYPEEEWKRLEEKVRALPNMDKDVKLFKRRVIASKKECDFDKQGRILIPADLREDAGIKGEIVIVGQIDRIELWNRKGWNDVVDVSNVNQEAVEEKLSELGL